MTDSMFMGNKKLIVTGDRILVSPPSAEERTDSGLYVPDSAIDTKKVLAGWVEAVGPGYPIPESGEYPSEPWKHSASPPVRHYPLQVEKGDLVLYVKNSSWEIRLDAAKYYVVPYSAVLIVLRSPLDVDQATE